MLLIYADLKALGYFSEPSCILPTIENAYEITQNQDHLDIVDFKPEVHLVPNLATEIDEEKLDNPLAPDSENDCFKEKENMEQYEAVFLKCQDSSETGQVKSSQNRPYEYHKSAQRRHNCSTAKDLYELIRFRNPNVPVRNNYAFQAATKDSLLTLLKIKESSLTETQSKKLKNYVAYFSSYVPRVMKASRFSNKIFKKNFFTKELKF